MNAGIGKIILVLITALIGCIVLAIGLGGWFRVNLSMISRILLVVGSVLLIMPRPIIANVVGAIICAAVLFIEIKVLNRKTVSSSKE